MATFEETQNSATRIAKGLMSSQQQEALSDKLGFGLGFGALALSALALGTDLEATRLLVQEQGAGTLIVRLGAALGLGLTAGVLAGKFIESKSQPVGATLVKGAGDALINERKIVPEFEAKDHGEEPEFNPEIHLAAPNKDHRKTSLEADLRQVAEPTPKP